MEKIQAALAKARAEREARAAGRPIPDRPEPAGPSNRPDPARHPDARGEAGPTPPQPQQPALDPNEPAPFTVPAISPDVEAAWQELDTFPIKPRRLRRNRVISFDGGAESSEIDMLRTRVLKQMRANGWRRLAITSPRGGCGKSTVALNLAFSLSRQADLRTVLCDMDFRNPSLGNILGVKDNRSFARVLRGESYLRAEALRLRPNLLVAPNQSRVEGSAELLQSPTVGPALDKIVYHYDPGVMIFDLPSMLSSDDTTAFLEHVDCALLVVGAGSSTIREVDTCEADLARQTGVLGMVLNKCRYMERD